VTCTAHGEGWTCTQPVKARGLCSAHRTQLARGQDLRPLRASAGLVCLPVRVSPGVAERASEDPAGARAALERWARS
jgi:hypothetical protein